MNGTEEKAFLSVKHKLINNKGMIKLESYHLKAIIIIDLDKCYQCITLKLVGKSLKSEKIFVQSQSISLQNTY